MYLLILIKKCISKTICSDTKTSNDKLLVKAPRNKLAVTHARHKRNNKSAATQQQNVHIRDVCKPHKKPGNIRHLNINY